MRLEIPQSAKNWVSLIGSMIAFIAFFLILFLFIISSVTGSGGTYLGLITFILLPGLLVFGLILIPIGMLISHKRKLKRENVWPIVDLNNTSHRNALLIFVWGTAIFVLLTAIGSYEAFRITESVEFCGELCHSVMHPEYTAYQHSPHARVACVECHVGEGADWYIRSKLSGLYQVYSVTFDLYPKPIPTPIHNLRPARETCEKCHWPQKFYEYKLRTEYHYLADEENTKWTIQLTMRIGAEHSAHGLKEGIHWHINPDIEVQYVAMDTARQIIPWVRFRDLKSGEEKIFVDEEISLDPEELAKYEVRTMDCMDCHNRPSHQYNPPALFINKAIAGGEIPVSLPEIKAQAVEVCDMAKDLPTMEMALNFIDSTITAYYQENYPEIYESNPDLVKQAANGIKKYFSRNIFPDMKVNWAAYPNNIGHLEFDGCFRCHNDRHATESGEVISKKCETCHFINAQGTAENFEVARFGESLEFRHPVDIGDEWKELLCTECHTGLAP